MEVTNISLVSIAIAGVSGFLLGAAVKYGFVRGIPSPRGIDLTQLQNGLMVAAPLVLGFYLMIISIVATQAFYQRGEQNAPRARLEQGLTALANMLKDAPEALKEVSSADNPVITTPESLNEVNPQLAGYIAGVSDQFKKNRIALENQPKSFVRKATEEINILVQQFDLQNRGRPGFHLTESHVDKLIQFFGTWISGWISTAKMCRNAINAEQTAFVSFVEQIKIVLKKPSPDDAAAFPAWPDPRLGPSLAAGCDFDAALSNSQIPSRGLVDPQLSVFGTMGRWLLETESRDLTLITGMLGFGLFGALAASFIRPDRTVEQRPQTVIRGIAAAVLIYLGVVGGLAVFTQESTPNPYALYFACLVAAVFSEDVWTWARQRQQERLQQGAQGAPPGAKPAEGYRGVEHVLPPA